MSHILQWYPTNFYGWDGICSPILKLTFETKKIMKKLFNYLLIIGLLVSAAATVKAESKPDVKPDSSSNSATELLIVKKIGGNNVFQYTDAQIFMCAGAAFAGNNFVAAELSLPAPGVAWLVLKAVRTDTISSIPEGRTIYLELTETTQGYIYRIGLWAPPMCFGPCWQPGGESNWPACKNMATGYMVQCKCDCQESEYMKSGCHFDNWGFPESTQQLFNNLHQIHD